MPFITIMLSLVFMHSFAEAAKVGNGWPILGVSKVGDQQFYAAIADLDIQTGNISFASPSPLYDYNSWFQPCINAKIEPNYSANAIYAIQTYDQTNDTYAFSILNTDGVMVRRKYSSDYQVIAWSYSELHKSLVSVGVLRTTKRVSAAASTACRGSYAMVDEGSFEVNYIDPSNGNIQRIRDVQASGVLQCAAVNSGEWFHYAWVDDGEKYFTTSIYHPERGLMTLMVEIPNEYGIIINLAASSTLGSTLVASTDRGILLMVQPELGAVAPIAHLDKKMGKVLLAGSLMINFGLVITLVKNDDPRAMIQASTFFSAQANSTILYEPVDVQNYTTFLGNF